MAVTVTFYNFSKRRNSTAVPSGGTALSCLLKEDTSLLAPSFIVHVESVPAWNYCTFQGRHYFVTDIVSIRNNQWMVSARVDVLATYKAAIAATVAYITYANAANAEIIDTRLPIKTTASVTYSTANVPHLSQVGTYLLSIVGAADAEIQNATKGPRTYALSAGALSTVLESVRRYIDDIGSASTDSMDAILAIGRQLIGAGSVSDNIRGCMWVPWDIVGLAGADVTLESIWLGLFNASQDRGIDVAGYALNAPVKAFSVSVTIPWTFSDWRRNSPYTQVYLYIPFVGMVQLSSENLTGASAVDVTIAINCYTGNMDCQVKAGGEMLGTYSASTGIGIPVGSGGAPSAYAAVGALAHGAAMVAGAMPHGAGAAAVLGTVAEASHIAPNTITAGNLSGGAGIGLDLVIACYVVTHDTAVSPHDVAATIGEPYNQAAAVGSISGFVQCAGASVKAPATQAELDEINAYLDGGIFYE